MIKYAFMNVFPSSIEVLLTEAGFTSTEVLILKRLLEDQSLTLRELAAKTGKSTGVLDQSLKKLLKKNIVAKEIVNEKPKYTLHSLQSITNWIEKHTQEQQEMILRRHKNFEAFVSSLELEKNRPNIEYFEGLEGMQQAYRKLLDSGHEMLHYIPESGFHEDESMKNFNVQYFRERRQRGIFSRVIAHNTPLGRRYQSRDPFEYRQTLLVPEGDHPFMTERILIGHDIACFNYQKKQASLLHYAELAEAERGIFEMIWNSEGRPIDTSLATSQSVNSQKKSKKIVPVFTETVSSLREFFLSKTSIAMLITLATVAAGATLFLEQYSSTLNFKRMQDKVLSIATTGVLGIDAEAVEALQLQDDWQKPEWPTVVNQLKEIRESNSNIIFVYVYRKSAHDPNQLEFVADSHSINPFANTDDNPSNNVDVDKNGVIDSVDVLQWPGQEYPTPPDNVEIFKALSEPIATSNFYEDDWGKMITGYAPIRTKDGNTIGVLAVDMKADRLEELNKATFKPILYFFYLFASFIIARFIAFHGIAFWHVRHRSTQKK